MTSSLGYSDSRGKHHDAYFHLDKGILAALLAVTMAILTQTGTFIWWASHISTVQVDQERRLTGIESWRESTATQNASIVKLTVDYGHLDHRVLLLEMRQPMTSKLPAGR